MEDTRIVTRPFFQLLCVFEIFPHTKLEKISKCKHFQQKSPINTHLLKAYVSGFVYSFIHSIIHSTNTEHQALKSEQERQIPALLGTTTPDRGDEKTHSDVTCQLGKTVLKKPSGDHFILYGVTGRALCRRDGVEVAVI